MSNKTPYEGDEMFTLIAFTVLVALLIVVAGLPYPQTWHDRWGSN